MNKQGEKGITWTDWSSNPLGLIRITADAALGKVSAVVNTMTISAPCYSIGDIVPKQRVRGEALKVMGLQVLSCAALPAGVPVTLKDGVPPVSVFGSLPQGIEHFGGFRASLPARVLRATRRRLDCTFAYVSALFGRQSLRRVAGLSFMRRAHLGFCFRRVLAAFEVGRLACSVYFDRNAPALQAGGFQSVASASVSRKVADWLPCFAFCAVLQSCLNAAVKFFKSDAMMGGNTFLRTFTSLGHLSNLLSVHIIPETEGIKA